MNSSLELLLNALPQRFRGEMAIARTVNSGEEFTVFVLDASPSMEAKDFPPTRYKAAVMATKSYLDARLMTGCRDKVAAVVFAGYATVICKGTPIERAERDVVDRLLGAISVGGGTNIEAGIVAAASIVRKNHEGYLRRLIVLSDGFGMIDRTGENLKAEGVVIDCIGIGGSQNEVDEELLKSLATVENGTPRYRFIGDGNSTELISHFRKIATDLVVA